MPYQIRSRFIGMLGGLAQDSSSFHYCFIIKYELHVFEMCSGEGAGADCLQHIMHGMWVDSEDSLLSMANYHKKIQYQGPLFVFRKILWFKSLFFCDYFHSIASSASYCSFPKNLFCYPLTGNYLTRRKLFSTIRVLTCVFKVLYICITTHTHTYTHRHTLTTTFT